MRASCCLHVRLRGLNETICTGQNSSLHLERRLDLRSEITLHARVHKEAHVSLLLLFKQALKHAEQPLHEVDVTILFIRIALKTKTFIIYHNDTGHDQTYILITI